MTVTQPLHAHHKHCDELFALAEEGVHRLRWDQCVDQFGLFRGELEGHFATEEQLLFPAFEAANGSTSGPPQVMRIEHQQMRGLMGEMAQALESRSAGAFAGLAETLLVLMQQHNMKEEHILYPMCDRLLASAQLPVADDLRQRTASTCGE